MDTAKRFVAIAAIAVAGLPTPGHSAQPVGSGAPAGVTPATPAARLAQAASPPARPLPRNGFVRRADPAASVASGTAVRITDNDGRPTTRDAHERNATTAASSPSSPNN
jgi:hypothetical protein